jgi:sugar-phosphatase
MINTVLYDMDGLLLDTEPLWGDCMERVALRHHIPITRDKFKETTGLRIFEVTDYWAHQYPWQGNSSHEIAEEILDEIIEASTTKATVMKGVVESLELLHKNGFKVGLASSSAARMIEALVLHFGLKNYFHCITSADEVSYGKPHPAVFLKCAEQLEANPLHCLVLEDSVNGLIAGKAARMKVIVVPEENQFHNPKFALADKILRSLEELNLETIEAL